MDTLFLKILCAALVAVLFICFHFSVKKENVVKIPDAIAPDPLPAMEQDAIIIQSPLDFGMRAEMHSLVDQSATAEKYNNTNPE